jgi:hypothetical protein
MFLGVHQREQFSQRFRPEIQPKRVDIAQRYFRIETTGNLYRKSRSHTAAKRDCPFYVSDGGQILDGPEPELDEVVPLWAGCQLLEHIRFK